MFSSPPAPNLAQTGALHHHQNQLLQHPSPEVGAVSNLASPATYLTAVGQHLAASQPLFSFGPHHHHHHHHHPCSTSTQLQPQHSQLSLQPQQETSHPTHQPRPEQQASQQFLETNQHLVARFTNHYSSLAGGQFETLAMSEATNQFVSAVIHQHIPQTQESTSINTAITGSFDPAAFFAHHQHQNDCQNRHQTNSNNSNPYQHVELSSSNQHDLGVAHLSTSTHPRQYLPTAQISSTILVQSACQRAATIDSSLNGINAGLESTGNLDRNQQLDADLEQPQHQAASNNNNNFFKSTNGKSKTVNSQTGGRKSAHDKLEVRKASCTVGIEAARRTFGCPICGKCFTEKFNMKRHMQIHAQSRPKYICNECSKSFAWKDNFIRHKKAAHGTNMAHLVSFEDKVL